MNRYFIYELRYLIYLHIGPYWLPNSFFNFLFKVRIETESSAEWALSTLFGPFILFFLLHTAKKINVYTAVPIQTH